MHYADDTLNGLKTCERKIKSGAWNAVSCSGNDVTYNTLSFSDLGCSSGACRICVRATNENGEQSANYGSGGTCYDYTVNNN